MMAARVDSKQSEAGVEQLSNKVEADLVNKLEGKAYEGQAAWRTWAKEASSNSDTMLDHLFAVMASQPHVSSHSQWHCACMLLTESGPQSAACCAEPGAGHPHGVLQWDEAGRPARERGPRAPAARGQQRHQGERCCCTSRPGWHAAGCPAGDTSPCASPCMAQAS